LALSTSGALAAAPQHVGPRAELGGEVHVPHDLAQRVPADVAVVGGERALLEHRVGEQVGRGHGDDEAGLLQRVLEALHVLGALGVVAAERDQVVVVEGDAGGAQLGEAVHALHRVERRAGRVAERVAGLPADGPEAEGEPVVLGGLRRGHAISLDRVLFFRRT
jgi:hypothetical protein